MLQKLKELWPNNAILQHRCSSTGTVQRSIEWLQPGMRRNKTMVLTQQSALTQKLRQNINYQQLGGMTGCTRSWQVLLNGSIFAVQNSRGSRRLSPRWLHAWQQWLMAICRGVTRGGTIPQSPSHHGGAKSLRGLPKSPKMSQVLSSMQYIFFPTTCFEHGGAKLVSCPGHHLTSLRPWPYGFVLILLLQVRTRRQLTPTTKWQICNG